MRRPAYDHEVLATVRCLAPAPTIPRSALARKLSRCDPRRSLLEGRRCWHAPCLWLFAPRTRAASGHAAWRSVARSVANARGAGVPGGSRPRGSFARAARSDGSLQRRDVLFEVGHAVLVAHLDLAADEVVQVQRADRQRVARARAGEDTALALGVLLHRREEHHAALVVLDPQVVGEALPAEILGLEAEVLQPALVVGLDLEVALAGHGRRAGRHVELLLGELVLGVLDEGRHHALELDLVHDPQLEGPAGQLREGEVEGQRFALLRVDAVLLALVADEVGHEGHRARAVVDPQLDRRLDRHLLGAHVEALAIAAVVAANEDEARGVEVGRTQRGTREVDARALHVVGGDGLSREQEQGGQGKDACDVHGQTLPAATRDAAQENARPAYERGGTAGPPNRSSRATSHDVALRKPRFK